MRLILEILRYIDLKEKVQLYLFTDYAGSCPTLYFRWGARRFPIRPSALSATDNWRQGGTEPLSTAAIDEDVDGVVQAITRRADGAEKDDPLVGVWGRVRAVVQLHEMVDTVGDAEEDEDEGGGQQHGHGVIGGGGVIRVAMGLLHGPAAEESQDDDGVAGNDGEEGEKGAQKQV